MLREPIVEVGHQFLEVLVVLDAEVPVLDLQAHQDAHQAPHQVLELVALVGAPLSVLQGAPVAAEELAGVLVHLGLR